MSNSEHGFTLLELMTVVLLIGLLAGVGLSMDFTDASNTPQQQARLLAQQFRLVSDEAVLSGSIFGLDFYRVDRVTGYRWLVHDGKHWRPLDAKVIDADSSEFALPLTQRLRFTAEGQSVEPESRQELDANPRDAFVPEILLLPTREFYPFRIDLSDANASISMQVDPLGRVEVDDAQR